MSLHCSSITMICPANEILFSCGAEQFNIFQNAKKVMRPKGDSKKETQKMKSNVSRALSREGLLSNFKREEYRNRNSAKLRKRKALYSSVFSSFPISCSFKVCFLHVLFYREYHTPKYTCIHNFIAHDHFRRCALYLAPQIKIAKLKGFEQVFYKGTQTTISAVMYT